MVLSPPEWIREVSHPAGLIELTHYGFGVLAPCQYDRGAQVDGTGPTTINIC